MTGIRIDIHPHVISPDTTKYPLDPLGGKRSTWSESAHSLTPAQLVAAMDRAGIDKCALVHSSTTYGYDNSLVSDAVSEFPDRITGVCSIDVLAPDAVSVLKGWIARGNTGLRMFTTGSTMPTQSRWLNDPKVHPVWDYASEIGLPICIQCKVGGFDMLTDLMERFPKVPVILDHLARPDLTSGPPYPGAEPLFALAEYPQLTLKFTPVSLRECSQGEARPETFLPKLVEVFGADRIAWGSNFPASDGDLPGMLAEAEAAFGFLSESDRDKVFGGNALRLYPSLAEKETA